MVIILCVFLTALILITAIVADIKNNGSSFLGLCGGIFVCLLLFKAAEEANLLIRPIDVYRGNTTLEITYRDSVAIDSVVVWKESKEK